jgi:hypothetical protein
VADVRTRAQKLLPGQPVRYAFTAEPWDPSFLKRWWMLIRGGSRVVAVTDRETVVMRTGGAAVNRKIPRRVIYRVPRRPLHIRHMGVSRVIDLGRERICVGPGVEQFIAQANMWVAGEGAPPVTVKPEPVARSDSSPELWVARVLAAVGWLAVWGFTRLLGAHPASIVGAGVLANRSRFLYELVGLLVVGLLLGLLVLLVIGLAFLLRPVGWVGHTHWGPITAVLRALGAGRAKRARAEAALDRRAAADHASPLVSQPWEQLEQQAERRPGG